ncbi:MAG: TasA family protein [Acutalibacteraceae bacterium]|nr:TasA family protein [Acutalibacteraceae bacterium]
MKKAIPLLLLSCTLLMGVSMAYFTDSVTTQASATAGTVAATLNNKINLLDVDGNDIIGPGDIRSAKMEIVNMGNKSIDVRTTIAMTVNSEHYTLNFTGDADNQSEYDLYLASDVELVEGYGYMPKTGAKPITVKRVDNNVIYYDVPVFSLNGNSDEYTEVETINGIGNFKYLYDYVLLFKNDTDNTWQDSVLTIDIVVESKQHENTGAGWDIVAHETIIQGSINKEAVVSENIITQQ